MKACKFCGTQVENSEQHCPSCGSAVFLHICENCGSQFDSGFCPNCGVKAGQGKKVCPECRTVYFSNACPNCGYTPSRKPVVQKVEQTVIHKHVYEEPVQKAPAPTQARRSQGKGKGCGCLMWLLIILVIAGIFGSRSSSRKSASSTRAATSVRTTSSVTKDPNVTDAPTATPEPAIAAAQEKVDQYFSGADEAEIAAVKEADSALYQYQARRDGKVLSVRRSFAEDRGMVGKSKYEPEYIGSLGYAAVSEGEKLEQSETCTRTPWTIPVYQKDKQFWKQAGTMEHKTEVVVIGQELEMPKRAYSTSRCSGYLHVIRMDTGAACWLNVENYVSSPYWEKGLKGAQEKGYCVATFRQVSDYYPVTKGNVKAELEDGLLVLLPMRSKVNGTSPDPDNNSIPGIVYEPWMAPYGGVTVWFHEADLTLTY